MTQVDWCFENIWYPQGRRTSLNFYPFNIHFDQIDLLKMRWTILIWVLISASVLYCRHRKTSEIKWYLSETTFYFHVPSIYCRYWTASMHILIYSQYIIYSRPHADTTMHTDTHFTFELQINSRQKQLFVAFKQIINRMMSLAIIYTYKTAPSYEHTLKIFSSNYLNYILQYHFTIS